MDHARDWQFWLILAVVLLIRIPFLNQAVQGDDVYYLAAAQHAQIDPAHPHSARYVFVGDVVDMRGHPHPPLNAWFLALLLAVAGEIREVPFHIAYILFSVVAAIAMWSLAKRFSPRPLWATLLFLATPAFVVNGNSFEADVPFLALWMASIALFVAAVDSAQKPSWPLWCGTIAMLGLSALAAFQAIFITPILGVYVWLCVRRRRLPWAVAMVPPLTILVWQLFERASTGTLPASVLSGYLRTYGLQALNLKLRNAAALSIHLGWLVFPALLPPALLASWRRRDKDTLFLAAWIALFFAGALVVFFAGSARYLLPIAAPVALLVSRLSRRWLAPAFALQLALGLGLASVNYQHWDGYRRFAQLLQIQSAGKRVWINGEWGLRYYLESAGALPLTRGRAIRPGDLVVSSELAYPVAFTTGGGVLTPIAEQEVRSWLPLRLIGLHCRSAYSTDSNGLRPFDISAEPIDRVRAELVAERKPTLDYLPMNAPEAAQQLVSGVYELEQGRWRWTGQRAVVLLKSPRIAEPLRAVFAIPDPAPARRVSLTVDGEEIAAETYAGPGSYTLIAPARMTRAPTATVVIAIDKVFSVPGDHRQLGIVLSEIGFRK